MNSVIKMPLDDLVKKELARQRETIELIASENFVSENILRFDGSILTNKYAEGYPNARYYNGCQVIDKVEQLAIDYAKKIFGANFVNVQPHSGSQANFAAYASLLDLGDTILSMDLNCGGHLTHGSKVSFSSKFYKFIHYFVNKETELLDYEEIEKIALEYKPKLIVVGYSNYSRIIDFARFQQIAQRVGAFLLADIAHVAGLVVANRFPNPLPYADIVTSTTQKTLRGPRGGLILTNNAEIFKKINSSVFPGNQGGPHEHIIAAKAACFYEAMLPSFQIYVDQLLKNAKVFAEEFMKSGYHVVAGGTDTHLFSINVFQKHQLTGNIISQWLERANITVNTNTVPFDVNTPKAPSGIRVGTAAMTTRGFVERDFQQLAKLMIEIFNSQGHSTVIENSKKQVANMLKQIPVLYPNL